MSDEDTEATKRCDEEARFLEAVERAKAKTKTVTLDTPQGKQSFAVHDIPLRCGCGAEWTGPAFTPLVEGEVRRQRTCDECLDRAEAASLAKLGGV